jgi:predicted nucleic acid-binding protein
MNGSSLVVDTNIFIYQLNGDNTIESVLQGENVFLSFISKIELLGYQKHSRSQEELIEEILRNTTIVHSNDTITELTIQFKKKNSIKTPDAIILATAAYLGLPLFTADRDLFKVTGVQIIQYTV